MFKITIEGPTMAELAANVNALAMSLGGTAPADAKPVTRRSSKKDEDPAAKADAEAPNATTLDASTGTEASSGAASDTASGTKTGDTGQTATTDASLSEGPSRDEALKEAMLYGQANGDDALKAKITAMGATKFSEIPADKYSDFLASLKGSVLD